MGVDLDAELVRAGFDDLNLLDEIMPEAGAFYDMDRGYIVEGVDPQVLLDPLEEQFHLPALFVDLRDGQCRKHEIVAQECQLFVGFGIVVADSAQRVRIDRGRLEGQQDL